jgi:hypothetical protein
VQLVRLVQVTQQEPGGRALELELAGLPLEQSVQRRQELLGRE